MGWTTEELVDPDQALRLLQLVPAEADDDFWMLIESKGKPIEGESSRKFEDGKPRLVVDGFRFQIGVVAPPGSNLGKLRASHLFLVRPCDAASASVACLLRDHAADLRVVLSAFKAGGESSPDMQPHLEYELKDARVISQTMLTSQYNRRPGEILQVAFDGFEIRSAPQQQVGLRGAVRTCAVGM